MRIYKIPFFCLLWVSLILIHSPGYAEARREALAGIRLLDTFNEHLTNAKKYDAVFLSAQSSEESFVEGTRYAQSLLRPKITLSASAFQTDRTEIGSNFFGQRSEIGRSFNSSIATLQARQPIYRPRDYLGIAQATSQQNAANILTKAALQDLKQRLLLSWLDIISSRELVSLYEKARDSAAVIYEEATKRYKSGDIARQEMELAFGRLLQARALVVEAEGRFEISRESLVSIVGPEAKLLDGGSIFQVDHLKNPFDNLKAAEKEALASNPDILAAREKAEASRIEKEKAKSDYKPVIDAYVSTSRGQNDSVSFIKDETRTGIQLNVPILTFGTLGSSLAQADANYRTQVNRTREVELKVRTDVVRDFNNINTIRERIIAADAEAKATQTMLKSQLYGLKAGLHTRAEVGRTLQDLVNIERQSIFLRKDFVISWIGIHASVSSLTDEVVNDFISNLSNASWPLSRNFP